MDTINRKVIEEMVEISEFIKSLRAEGDDNGPLMKQIVSDINCSNQYIDNLLGVLTDKSNMQDILQIISDLNKYNDLIKVAESTVSTFELMLNNLSEFKEIGVALISSIRDCVKENNIEYRHAFASLKSDVDAVIEKLDMFSLKGDGLINKCKEDRKIILKKIKNKEYPIYKLANEVSKIGFELNKFIFDGYDTFNKGCHIISLYEDELKPKLAIVEKCITDLNENEEYKAIVNDYNTMLLQEKVDLTCASDIDKKSSEITTPFATSEVSRLLVDSDAAIEEELVNTAATLAIDNTKDKNIDSVPKDIRC